MSLFGDDREPHCIMVQSKKSIILFKQLTPWNSKFSLSWKYFTYVAVVRWHTQPFIGLTFETCSMEMLNTWSNSVWYFLAMSGTNSSTIFPSKHCSPCWTDCLWILVTRDLWNPPFCVEWSLRPSFAKMPPLMASPCHGDEETELSTCIADVQAWSMEPFEFVMRWSIARCFSFVKLSSFTASLPKTTPLSGTCIETIFLWQTSWTNGLPSFFTSTILADVWKQFWGCVVETNKFNR